VTLSAATLNQDVDYCTFEGLECKGYPVLTLLRGEVIAENGKFVGREDGGLFLRRGPHTSLS
jgi:dihydropyrimidinase